MECCWGIESPFLNCIVFGIFRGVADVVRCDNLRWFGNLEYESADD